MAPTKLEKHIKNKLKNREIKPSAKAWDSVLESLEEEPKKNKNGFRWYAVAASFIGLIIASVLFFNSGKTELSTEEQIVTVPDETIDVEKETEKNTIELELETRVVEANDKPIQQIKAPKASASIEKQVAQEIKREEINQVVEVAVEETETLLNAKINEVVAQVQLLENSSNEVTNAEVDSLLRKAQRELLTDKIFMDNQKVNAITLLNEVEKELDQSFRDQIFTKLKTGFLKVRTAVADRNN